MGATSDQCWLFMVRPTVTIYGEGLTTKCGKSGVNAFYCTADQQVYYSNLLPEVLPAVRRTSGLPTSSWRMSSVMHCRAERAF